MKPATSFRRREPLRIHADEDFTRELRDDRQPEPAHIAEERRRLDDADAWAVIRDVACPACGAIRGNRCFVGSNDAHYERRSAFARRPITRHLEGDA